MSINKKILTKVVDKTKNDPSLKKAANNLLIIESEGIGQYKDDYKKIIEECSGETKDED